MEPVVKELSCPECGGKASVRLMPQSSQHRWHCPNCHKLQTTDGQTAAAAPQTG